MRKLAAGALALAWALIGNMSVSTTSLMAQAKSPHVRQVAVLLQGEEIKLPEDFVARLDGNNLKVALKSMGLAEKYPDRELLVTLIQDDGSKSELRPDENGELVFNNVKEGLASIVVASGQMAYAAMAIYAIPSVGNQAPTAAFEVPVASVEVNEIRSGVEAAGQGPTDSAARQFSDYAAVPTNRFQVYLQSDGTLKGQVIVPQVGFERAIGPVDLTFFRDGRLVGKTRSTEDGIFLVPGLQPGVHSVFAVGNAGHTAFAFEVLPAALADADSELPFSQRSTSTTRLVAARNAQAVPSDELIVLIIPPRMMTYVREVVRTTYPPVATPDGLAGDVGMPLGGFPAAPGFGAPGFGAPGFGAPGMGGFAGSGMGGGIGGGGAGLGGIGGIGGLGGLLGIAGLAVGVASLADDDGIDSNLATPIVPAQ